MSRKPQHCVESHTTVASQFKELWPDYLLLRSAAFPSRWCPATTVTSCSHTRATLHSEWVPMGWAGEDQMLELRTQLWARAAYSSASTRPQKRNPNVSLDMTKDDDNNRTAKDLTDTVCACLPIRQSTHMSVALPLGRRGYYYYVKHVLCETGTGWIACCDQGSMSLPAVSEHQCVKLQFGAGPTHDVIFFVLVKECGTAIPVGNYFPLEPPICLFRYQFHLVFDPTTH